MDSSEIRDYSLGCKLIKVGWISQWLLKDTHFVWLEGLTTKEVNIQ